MSSVRLAEVSKHFGPVVALDNLSLNVADGEFLVLVGPSGCGKTTALRIIAGLEDATTGQVYVGDREVTDVAPKNRDIAMVFQDYALYPHMSVYDNLAFSLQMRRTVRLEVERRVKDVAELLGLGELLRRKPGQLSGGQRQRVALGRAIIREPQVFLMDEPLSNLDAKLRVSMRAELSRLHRRLGATIIFVTHDQVEAMTMARRIAVLHEGRLQQLDSPQGLYDRPRNLFVAGFIGSPAINTLAARYHDGSFVGDGFRIPLEGQSKVPAAPAQELVLGIRPEDMRILDGLPAGQAGAPPAAVVRLGEGTVDLVETLGSDTFLTLSGPWGSVVVRVEPRSEYTPGRRLPVGLTLDRLHVFDAATGEAIR
jgi:multiple sugar transport system ATP-binding protein